jgi:hypothetical protein
MLPDPILGFVDDHTTETALLPNAIKTRRSSPHDPTSPGDHHHFITCHRSPGPFESISLVKRIQVPEFSQYPAVGVGHCNNPTLHFYSCFEFHNLTRTWKFNIRTRTLVMTTSTYLC